MKVLVTGGGGFLGGAIVGQLLARGDTVRSFARGAYPELEARGVEVHRGELVDARAVARAVEGCDAVCHVAAKVGGGAREEAFYAVNVRGTDHVIAACREHGVRGLVYTSTPSVVHDGDDVCGVDESAPYARAFLAPYPATKAMAERRVLAANDEALATVSLRPHLIWGPGDPHLLPRLVERARKRRAVLPAGPSRYVDPVHVDDAARAHVAALDRLASCAGRAYFITGGEPIATDELLQRILAAVGEPPIERRASPRTLRAAGWLLERAWRLLDRDDEPPLSRFAAAQLTTSHFFSIDAARRDLGWRPRVTFAEGLKQLSRGR